jgi:drug/metabolite transporter (DMT)-like permease
MAVLLGLGAALAYGLGDFLAGLLSRRVHYALVAVVGHVVACALTALMVVVTAPTRPSSQALLWGAASGVGSALGTLVLYRGLGRGRMGVVAPLSALGAAVLPVIIGVALGDRPSGLAWTGVALALPAIWLVSTTGSSIQDPAEEVPVGPPVLATGVVDGLLAGVAFALLFVALNLAGDGSGLWPVAVGQACALVLLALFSVGSFRKLDSRRLAPRQVGGAVSVGVLGAAAAVLYFVSTQIGLLSIVAVLTSLYPAATVLLAAVVLHETVSRRQGAGLLLAAAAVALIVVA